MNPQKGTTMEPIGQVRVYIVGLPAALAVWHLLEFTFGCLAQECTGLENMGSYPHG